MAHCLGDVRSLSLLEETVIFTNTDKALLFRCARILTEEALSLKYSHSPWGINAESREAKRRHDRLLRDARDLQELAKQLLKENKPAPDPAPGGPGNV